MSTWDCVVINVELDLLEIRLRELDPVVDHFVVVESPVTYRGATKPLYLQQNLDRFTSWSHKLIPLVSPADDLEDAHPREREARQKRWALQGLRDADPDDLVLVGDLDEIPSREVVARLAVNLVMPTRLVMRHAYYRANLVAVTPWYDGTKACRARDVDDPEEMGKLVGRLDSPYRRGNDRQFQDAGWHLAYMGGWDDIKTKNASNVMADSRAAAVSGAQHHERCVELGVHTSAKTRLHRFGPQSRDAQMNRLQAWAPAMFDERPAPRPRDRTVYEVYTMLLVRGVLPLPVIAAIDSRPRLWLTIMRPALIALHTAVRLRSRAKQHVRAVVR
jgi:hypothetical protein